MTDREFEESVKEYYQNKQKEYPPEKIYVDLNKIVKEKKDLYTKYI